jgi:hypothetical protein
MNRKNLLLCITLLLVSSSLTSQDYGTRATVDQVKIHDTLTVPSSLQVVQTFGNMPMSKRPSNQIPITTHEKFASFLSGNDFKSLLLLENMRPDLPITFRPSLILKAGEVSLDPVTVSAHSTATVDINSALRAHGYSDERGTIAVQFDFASYGPGSAVVEMRDDKHHLYLNSYAQSAEEYWNGTEYDAVVWTPQEGTQGFISITNSSSEAHVVHTTFLVDGQSEPQPGMQIAPRQTRIVPIDGLLARTRRSGGGIHIEYQQEPGEKYPGAILVEGQLFNKKTGFAKHIHFIDRDLQYPTGTLRTHFLLLGQQPAEDNFPADVSFRSVAAVRNVDSVPVMVTPTVKFLENGSLQIVTLPSRSLAPAESQLIDFNEERNAGRLPSSFKQGSLELAPDSGRTSIVGELFNFSSSGGYVVGPSFSSYPNRSTASIWRTDGTFQTTVMVSNSADDDRVTLRLYSDSGTYKKTFDIPAEGLLKINVRDLQQNRIADDDGNLLLSTSGVLSLVGGHNTRSKLEFDKIIHSTNQSEYVGLPPNPCDFVTVIGLVVDGSSDGNQPFPVMKEYEWSIAGPEDEIASGTFVSNGLAQINNNGSGDFITFGIPDDNQDHTVTISPPFPQEVTQFCDACSFGDVMVVGTSVSTAFRTTYWGPPVTRVKDQCFWGSLACSPGTTPTCTTGRGFPFFPGCPQYVKASWFVVLGECISFVLTTATGPGPCN